MPIQTVNMIIDGVIYAGIQVGDQWTFNIDAPAVTSFHQPGRYYDVTLQAISTDGLISTINSQHSIHGQYLQLFVVERIDPIITVTYPDDGAHVPEESPVITFQLREEPQGSGIDLSTLYVELDRMAIYDINVISVQHGYDCSFTTSTLALGIHTLIINVKDNDGNPAITMIRAFTRGLIFDRTQADIDMALALERHNTPFPFGNLKISWDWRALNRIEKYTEYLVDLLTRLGYSISIITKTDWDTTTVNDFVVEGQRILNNIQKMVNTFYVLPTTPKLPDNAVMLTYLEANDIEKVLHDLTILVTSSLAAPISGEIFAGDTDWV